MHLEKLGYNINIEKYRTENGFDTFLVGRVMAEHRERYVVQTDKNEYDAEVIGNLRYTAQSRFDYPAVGDWVALSEYDHDKGIIHAIFPRKSIIAREAVGKKGEHQIIATNIDTAFIMLAVDRDFSINRMERYQTICNSSNVKPVIILSKTDLIPDHLLSELTESIRLRVKNVPLLTISNQTLRGIEKLRTIIKKGETYCLLGSSGVGKSTLLNTLMGEDAMKTDAISDFSNRGRHVTTHRELKVLEDGGIIIDNPGMREVGIANNSTGLEVTYDTIAEYAKDCKFKDCDHINDNGCAVITAVESGEIERSSYQNFLKLVKESAHFESSVQERRKKDKSLAKTLKNYKRSDFKKY